MFKSLIVMVLFVEELKWKPSIAGKQEIPSSFFMYARQMSEARYSNNLPFIIVIIAGLKNKALILISSGTFSATDCSKHARCCE